MKHPRNKKPHTGQRRRRPAGRRLDPKAAEAIEQQLKAFRERFGRDPQPDEPIFFDPDARGDEPLAWDAKKLLAEMIVTMMRAGMPEHLVYAYIRTDGLILTEENQENMPTEAVDEWNAAMADFDRFQERLSKDEAGPERFLRGSFQELEGGGTPTFVLDDEMASEFLIKEEPVLAVLVQKLVQNRSWFMLSPPQDNPPAWCLYTEAVDAPLVEEHLKCQSEPWLTRGLHTEGAEDEDEDGDSGTNAEQPLH